MTSAKGNLTLLKKKKKIWLCNVVERCTSLQIRVIEAKSHTTYEASMCLPLTYDGLDHIGCFNLCQMSHSNGVSDLTAVRRI